MTEQEIRAEMAKLDMTKYHPETERLREMLTIETISKAKSTKANEEKTAKNGCQNYLLNWEKLTAETKTEILKTCGFIPNRIYLNNNNNGKQTTIEFHLCENPKTARVAPEMEKNGVEDGYYKTSRENYQPLRELLQKIKNEPNSLTFIYLVSWNDIYPPE